jgi:hypothetical protein
VSPAAPEAAVTVPRFRPSFEPLEGRAVPAGLPAEYAVGQDTATIGSRLYDDPTGIRNRTGDPSLAGPYATAYAADGTYQYGYGLGPAFVGGVRVARADVTGDGVTDLVVASGPGTPPRLRVYDGARARAVPPTDPVVLDVAPFEAAFTGGVYVAAGDLTGDGTADLVVTPDQGGGPRVVVLRGGDFAPVASFLGIDDPNFRGGARTAVGDFDGDGRDDLVVATGFGGGPRVAVYAGPSLTGTPARLFNDRFVFEDTLRNGAFVAAGDLNADGKADLFAAGGPGGGPRVLVLSGGELVAGRATPLANFFAGSADSRSGVRIAVKNLDGDARADLLAASGPGTENRVRAYSGTELLATPAGHDVPSSVAANFTDGFFVG